MVEFRDLVIGSSRRFSKPLFLCQQPTTEPLSSPSIVAPLSNTSPTTAPSQACTGVCHNQYCQDVLMRYNILVAQLLNSMGASAMAPQSLQPNAHMFVLPPPMPASSGMQFGGIAEQYLKGQSAQGTWVNAVPNQPSELPAIPASVSPTAIPDMASQPGERAPVDKMEITSGAGAAHSAEGQQEEASSAPMQLDSQNRNAEADAKCRWATCTAEFRTAEELLPHISKLHLSANRLSHVVKRPRLDRSSPALSPVTDEATPNPSPEANAGSSTPTTVTPPEQSFTAQSAGASFLHACKWALCTLSSFFSVDDLIQHLCSDHLALSAGNTLLHVCLWLGCSKCSCMRPIRF